jgi:hypothetical protein
MEECIMSVRKRAGLLSRILARSCEGTEVTLAVMKIIEMYTRYTHHGAAKKTYSMNSEGSTAMTVYV